MVDKVGEGVLGLFLRLRKFGINNESLFSALESVPRQQFILPEYINSGGNVWRDESYPLPCGQMLWSPDISARILAAAQLKRGDTVLELGCGSGYLTALASRLCRKVRSIERYGKLVDQARLRLSHLGIGNVALEHGDGFSGTPSEGLYDCILCDSCYEVVPEFLKEQLVSGGVVIVAVGGGGEEQQLVKLTLKGTRFISEDLFKVRFTMMERGVARSF